MPLSDALGLVDAQPLQEVLTICKALVGAFCLKIEIFTNENFDDLLFAVVGSCLLSGSLAGIQVCHIVGHVFFNQLIHVITDNAVGNTLVNAARIRNGTRVNDVRIITGG